MQPSGAECILPPGHGWTVMGAAFILYSPNQSSERSKQLPGNGGFVLLSQFVTLRISLVEFSVKRCSFTLRGLSGCVCV